MTFCLPLHRWQWRPPVCEWKADWCQWHLGGRLPHRSREPGPRLRQDELSRHLHQDWQTAGQLSMGFVHCRTSLLLIPGIWLSSRIWQILQEWLSEFKEISESDSPYSIGWVNLYQKLDIEKYTVYGKLIFPKTMERHFFIFFWHNWFANLHGFANICKLPVSNTFKDMQSKIW